MAKNLELISDYYKYKTSAKFLTSVGVVNILLGIILSPLPPTVFLSAGFSLVGFNIGAFINIKDDLSRINEIQKIYDEIIKHYSKLNKVFDFNNPVEIFALYVYALKKGYLSLHHDFQYDEVEKEIYGLLGSEIMLGAGVCRNITAMLNDIFNESGVVSKQCNVFLADEDEKKSHISNHVIVTTEKDGLTYLLDPTNYITFKPSDSKSIYVSGDDYIYINPYERLKLGRNLEFTSEKDDEKLMKKTTKICSKNRDILKSFYKENKDLYEEISQKKLSLQKYF